MFLIVGLGNPGSSYRKTRHNIGFRVIDALSEMHHIPLNHEKHQAIFGSGYIEGTKVILAQPQTYMNLSGESIRPLADYYKVDPESELIVVSDDITLSPGGIRIRKKGSAGGHNGLKNIIGQLGTEKFKRIRIGVGEKPKGYDLADYVLGHFSKEEQPLMQEGITKAMEALNLVLAGNMDQAMNEYNRREK